LRFRGAINFMKIKNLHGLCDFYFFCLFVDRCSSSCMLVSRLLILSYAEFNVVMDSGSFISIISIFFGSVDNAVSISKLYCCPRLLDLERLSWDVLSKRLLAIFPHSTSCVHASGVVKSGVAVCLRENKRICYYFFVEYIWGKVFLLYRLNPLEL
jgi:hypothetical protein